MRTLLLGAAMGLSLAAPSFARDIILGFPVACELGEDCFLLNLMDADPGQGAADYTCGPRSYNGHKGTDVALPSLRAMSQGVDVLAAAPGRVRGMRVDMSDHDGDLTAQSLDGRKCGNGVVVDHGGGWETQYCHLRQGSVKVATGDAVRMGQVLGLVGMSGQTEYPHLHISVRKDGQPVDPFHPDDILLCGESPITPQLWQDPIAYPFGGIIDSGIAPYLPNFDQIKSGDAAPVRIQTDAPSLVGWSFVQGVQAGDTLRIRLTGPDGLRIEQDTMLEKQQVLAFRAVGRKAAKDWPPGHYKIISWLIRDRKVLDLQQATIELLP